MMIRLRRLLSALISAALLASVCITMVPSASAASEDYPLRTEDILIRDPYILPYEGKYYMYGTDGATAFSGSMDRFLVWVSEDLEHWSEPHTIYEKTEDFWADAQYWAPEVYCVDGTFYLYGSMGGSSRATKGIQLFTADNPLGPFQPVSDAPFTPEEDDDIDATLFTEDGVTYMVYSQGSDGMYAVALTESLDAFAGQPFELFDVADCDWAIVIPAGPGDMILNDGACFYTTSDGTLLCFFSSMSADGYNMGIAHSDNGRLDGNWTVTNDRIDVGTDGGHCMVFETFEGDTMLCYHAPNGDSRPVIQYLIEETPETGWVSVADLTSDDLPFTDVAADDRYAEAVQYVLKEGIMYGVDDTTFDPNGVMTRAMFVTALARLDGTDTDGSTPWYDAGCRWAVAKGISDGSAMDSPITREQLVAMLYRYAGSPAVDAADTAASPWAANAVAWATDCSILSGTPSGLVTRGEAADMLLRFASVFSPA